SPRSRAGSTPSPPAWSAPPPPGTPGTSAWPGWGRRSRSWSGPAPRPRGCDCAPRTSRSPPRSRPRPTAPLRCGACWPPSPRTARARALADLEAQVDAAAAEVRTAHQLADGLIERRTELRGRFEAYRAKANPLGVSERPDLLALDGDVRRLLWTDLAAATRALASYQRLLAAGDDTAGRTA